MSSTLKVNSWQAKSKSRTSSDEVSFLFESPSMSSSQPRTWSFGGAIVDTKTVRRRAKTGTWLISLKSLQKLNITCFVMRWEPAFTLLICTTNAITPADTEKLTSAFSTNVLPSAKIDKDAHQASILKFTKYQERQGYHSRAYPAMLMTRPLIHRRGEANR